MKIKDTYNYVIIGAGSAGLTVAVGLKSLNKDFLLVSKNIGGECTHAGCVPSKSLLHLSKQYSQKQLQNSTTIFEKVREKISEIEKDDLELLNGVEYLLGSATFSGKNRVLVKQDSGETKEITFGICIIATGSSPSKTKILDLDKSKILTNETIFNLNAVPTSLHIIGGGPIGAELATAFNRLGTKVTIISTSPFLNREPRTTAQIVKKALTAKGVTIIEGTTAQKREDGKLVLTDGSTLEDAQYYLMAIGRSPNTNIGLENADIEYDEKGISVDNNFKTSNPRVYAIGDCINLPKFTHLANNQARFLVSKLAFPLLSKKPSPLPSVTFTEPPIASVGITEESELIKGFIIDFSSSDRAKIDGQQNLQGVIFVHMLTGKIKGASIVGDFSEHIINFFTLAIYKNVSIFQLNNFIVPYPTYFSSLNTLFRLFLQAFLQKFFKNIGFFVKKNLNRILAVGSWLIFASFIVNYLLSVDFNTSIISADIAYLLSMSYGVPIYIILYCMSGIISLPVTILTLLGGSIFGFGKGLLLTVLASNLSSVIAYYYGKTIFAGEKNKETHRLTKIIQKEPFNVVLAARLTFVPYSLVSYIAGATQISFWKFILATAIGSLPGTLAIISFGASIQDITMLHEFRINLNYLGFSFLMIICSLIINKMLKKKRFLNNTKNSRKQKNLR